MRPEKIRFTDTSLAFASKSDKELKQMALLFAVMNRPWIVKIGTLLAIWALGLGLPVRRLIKNTVFKQFVGGEYVEECEEAIESLGASNIKTILDYSIEGENSAEGFEMVKREIFKIIEIKKTARFLPFCVIKLTGLGPFEVMEKVQAKAHLTIEEKEAYRRLNNRVEEICKRVYEVDSSILIDAEESWIQDTVDEITYEMMARFNGERPVVYNTYQMYRTNMYDNLTAAHQRAVTEGYYLGAKLVRGAYMEKETNRAEELGYEDPIQPDKEHTDTCFNNGLKYCVENIDRIGLVAGTHNEDSCSYLAELMNIHQLDNNDKRVYFAQLLGMSDNISFTLAAKGYNVAKYVPYGPVEKVVPYLSRRAEENTSIAGQSSREYGLIMAEVNRRKNKAVPKLWRNKTTNLIS